MKVELLSLVIVNVTFIIVNDYICDMPLLYMNKNLYATTVYEKKLIKRHIPVNNRHALVHIHYICAQFKRYITHNYQ